MKIIAVQKIWDTLEKIPSGNPMLTIFSEHYEQCNANR